MKKITVIAVALVAVFVTNAADLTEAVKSKLSNAIKNGDFVAAAQWSATLNNLKQAEFAEKQTRLVKKVDGIATVYDNLLKSAPAILDGLILYNKMTDPECKNPGSEGYKIVSTLELVSKVLKNPLSKKDIAPIVSTIANEELKEQAAMREEAAKHVRSLQRRR